MSNATATAKRTLDGITDTSVALQLLVAGQVTQEDYLRWDDARKAASRPQPGKVTVKVRPLGVTYTDSSGVERTGKGNVLVYGLQRMPVSLYPGQWERLLEPQVIAEIKAAIEEHRSALSWK